MRAQPRIQLLHGIVACQAQLLLLSGRFHQVHEIAPRRNGNHDLRHVHAKDRPHFAVGPDAIQFARHFLDPAERDDQIELLLAAYGGIWMDATIFLSGPIPEDYTKQDFFVFRRDPSEPDRRYWRNTYAYYFGWAKGFRVNMLNSLIVARCGNRTISDLCDLMLSWWKEHDSVPDYFFFQILFDVYAPKDVCPIVSDTLPHYLQQSINDPSFKLMSREEILRTIPIHKLTYK